MAQLTIKKGLALSLFSLLGCLVLLAALEVGLRALGFEHPPGDDPIAIWNQAEDRELRLGRGLHRFEGRQLWEPRPGAEIPSSWTGGRERVNSAGFRGPRRARDKPPGVLRIATLGDSSTFGYGLGYADSYPSQLEARLIAAGVRAEVLDFGVIGFTLLQGIERYQARVREYRPDVVIAAFGAVNEHHMAQGPNDAEKIAGGSSSETALGVIGRRAREQLRLFHLLASWKGREADSAADDEAARRQLEAETMRQYAGKLDFESVHRGVRRVSTREFEEGLARLAKLVAADGARLVLVSMPRRPGVDVNLPILRKYSQAILDFATANSTLVLDGRGDFRAYVEIEHGDPHYFFLEGDDYHPSKRGHARLAQRLFEIVVDLKGSH